MTDQRAKITIISSRGLVAIGLVFVALVVLYAMLSGSSSKPVPASASDLLAPDFDPVSLHKISIYHGEFVDSGVVLVKDGADWKVETLYDAPVSTSQMDIFFEELQSATKELRSEKEELLADFRVGKDEATHLVLYGSSDSKLLHLLFGKQSPDFRGCFVRYAGDSRVYLTNKNFLSRLGIYGSEPKNVVEADRWVEKRLTSLKRQDVDRVELTTPRGLYAFEKQMIAAEEDSADTAGTAPPRPTERWAQVSPEKGRKVEESRIKSLVSSLVNCRGKKVVDPSRMDEYGLKKDEYSAKLVTASGEQVTIIFGRKADEKTGDRYVMAEDSPVVFTTGKYNFENVFVRPFEDKK